MVPKPGVNNTCDFFFYFIFLIQAISFLVQSYLTHQQRLATSVVTCGSFFTVGLGHETNAVSY